MDRDCGSLLSSGQFTPEIGVGWRRRPDDWTAAGRTFVCFLRGFMCERADILLLLFADEIRLLFLLQVCLSQTERS